MKTYQRQRNLVKPFSFITLLTLLAIVVSWFLPGCAGGGLGSEISSAFQEAAPKPEWWDAVKAPRFETYDEMIAYWQDPERTPNEFFKACYQSILAHPEDDDIVVNAINLMPHGDASYPHTVPMLQFALDHYIDYDRPLVNYGGKTGDTIAGIARTLAKRYNRAGDYASAIEVVERLLDRREYDINDQLLELIALEYGEALYNYDRKDEAVAALQRAIDDYDGDWEKQLQQRLADYNP